MAKYDATNNELVANGQLYAQQATTAGAQIGPSGARRCVAIMAIAGTGNVTLYDGTSTAGNVIFPTTAMAVGTRYVVDTPCVLGIYAVVAAATTVNIIYS